MSPRGERLGQALEISWAIRTSIGNDVRSARLGSGIAQRTAAASVRMSHAQFGRIERAELRSLTVEQLSRACAAVGLRLAAQSYPIGEATRDRAQLALLGRFRAHVPPGVPWLTEVPIPIPGDLRSWDGEATFDDGIVMIEAESRLRDIQALDRRIALKHRDSGVDRVILLVNSTATNRGVLREHREALRGRFPLDGREILKSIRAGHAPVASGILAL